MAVTSYKYYIHTGAAILFLSLLLIIAWTRSDFSTTYRPNPPHYQAHITEYKEFLRVPDVYNLHTRVYNRTHGPAVCNNTCDVGDVFCKARTVKEWDALFKKEDFPSVPLFSTNEYFFPWELNYLKTPRLSCTKCLPDLTRSYLRFEDDGNSNNSLNASDITLTIDVPAIFRVYLVDSNSRRRTSGGDEVRAWLTGPGNDSAKENMAVAAKVKDVGDGSYDVIVTPKWTGRVQLHVAVTYPREYIRATLHQRWVGVHRYMYAMFKNGDIVEITVCHPTPNIPGRPCLCNMTKFNGVPYYCGRPLDNRLSCEDKPHIDRAPIPAFQDLTPAEKVMAKIGSRSARDATINHKLSITVNGTSTQPVLPPCYNSSRRASWTTTSPRGFWSRDKDQWTSLVCHEPEMTPEWFKGCLRSTSLWMIGDSNVRKMVEYTKSTFGCSTGQFKQWPKHIECRNDTSDTRVYLRPHAYPMYVTKKWTAFMEKNDVAETFNLIPSTGSHVVVIHYYLHFSPSHLSVLLQSLVATKNAVIDLLSRNPNVLVAVRGPHISTIDWARNHMFGGDVMGSRMHDIYLETFRDLQDKVVFLDGWDMSIGLENRYLHPPRFFYLAMWRTILSYKCN